MHKGIQRRILNFSLICQCMQEDSAENGWPDGKPDGHRVMTLELDL